MLPIPGSVGAEPSDHRAPLGRTAWEADVLFHETQEPVLRPTSPLGGGSGLVGVLKRGLQPRSSWGAGGASPAACQELLLL